jgi:hypothetical protein
LVQGIFLCTYKLFPWCTLKRLCQNKFINNFKIVGSREELIPLREYKANTLLACLFYRRIVVWEDSKPWQLLSRDQ